MAIMKWGTPPSGNQHDRHSHVVGHGEGVALVHAVRGEKVGGSGAQDTGNPNHGPATKWSTAPYKGPATDEADEAAVPNPWGYRSAKRAKKCMGNGDTCNAWATAKYDGQYCNAHGRQEAGLPAWPPNEKKLEPSEDEET